MTDSDKPTTEAGKALIEAANALPSDAPNGVPVSLVVFVRHAVPRIEAAARADALAEAAEKVRALRGIGTDIDPETGNAVGWTVSRAAVIDILLGADR
jgi:hypothetical protein